MTTKKEFPPVFVINLKSSADRREVMAERLKPLQIEYSFFEAVNGHALDIETLPSYEKTRRRLFFGRDLKKGEIGCLLSHRAVYQHIVDNNIDTAVILEDDVFPTPDFPDVVRVLIKHPVKWDMIRFLDSKKVYKKSRVIGALGCGSYALTRISGAPGGAYGYMITQKAARKLLQNLQKYYLPIDIIHGYIWQTGLEIFAVKPSPVSPDDEVDSTIGGTRFDKTLQISGWQKAVYPLTRLWLKISELVGKRLSYWSSWPRDMLLKRQWDKKQPPPDK